ncbi:MAG: hypothetical protein DRH26_11625 [Deltaproteobacteria bacterium]|nr:MAG: hypothetical protein DRH26_11625 [Deltaproteobacteria bacterium]
MNFVEWIREYYPNETAETLHKMSDAWAGGHINTAISKKPYTEACGSDGCVGTTHWEACESCRNFDDKNGCVLKKEPPFSLYLSDWILCDDYEAS